MALRRPSGMLAAALFGVAIALASPYANAQTASSSSSPSNEAGARQHFRRGVDLVSLQDYNGALAEFEASYAMSPRPSVMYNIGLAHQALHHYPEAARALEQYLREATEIPPDRRQRIDTAIAEIREFIAELSIRGVPQGAVIRVDGVRVGLAPLPHDLPVSTGTHTVEATAAGYRDAREIVTVAGGDRRELVLEMRAERPTDVNTSGLRVDVEPANVVVRVEIDAQGVERGQWRGVPSGTRRVSVVAAGWETYLARVRVAEGERRDLHVVLRRPGTALSPVPFAIVAAGAVLFGGGAIVMGALAQSDYNRFQTLSLHDPMAPGLARQGNSEVVLADVFLGVSGLAVVGAVVLLTQTRFSSASRVVDVGLGPAPGGGTLTMDVRF